ncbi:MULTISPECIES: 4-alpha-glucanotransferase [Pseudonocardia]|uniref:4-alpha-glucanotransferase n=2 Tax=Pseudonocardia TaxID=1847 RepID=A0A1Y2MJB9_PSEAH|nr:MULTISPECIES: 4-alpha-glucanotransferase [Pseudonocardia]OSY35365.1 4-alpha-glucanotransferase [Pseudonocardia autotrophica]TDN75469.1 4-alpha-glucanotransferase [Pseudonocardia autotrophica]BBF99435.1 4-alpha-glucanotransferase [Pseudonocardia autotrophica]GEC28521.1 4-alpha-glucanotransferase [Pseudonocardia saturnea]
MTRDPVDPELAEIADAYGVATSYLDGTRTEKPIDAAVVRNVLGLLEIDVSGPGAQRVALAGARQRAPLPATIGHRADRSRPLPGRGRLTATDGDAIGRASDVDGVLPTGLEPGRYLLETDAGRSAVVVAPPALPDPPRTWGWMLQLYALHSQRSWGIGDLGDLTELVRGGHGAGAVLLNPLHAITPVPPVQPSPYMPSSRRYTTPLALRVTDLPAYAAADAATRAEVDALRPETTGDRIAHDRVWAAKRSALEALWRSAGHPDGEPDPDLTSFATYCALAERYGARWSRWPSDLRRPDGAGIAAAHRALAPRIAFHTWVQRQAEAQLAGVRSAAREAGMPVGVIHDLAVGCDPEGADAWMWQDVLALDASVGAPPDAFNQRGQSWGLPPWRPDRLAATGFGAFGDMVRALLQHADGLRIDHVMGLWRLWWVPAGESADRGTYVHYDADAMLAVLLLEAHRADALVVGEDLGTVLPRIREDMTERNLLGSTVLWFSRDPDPVTGGDDGPLRRPSRWPERSVATISTHDLPTASGFLRGEHVRVRAELDLLDDPRAEEVKAAVERDELLALLAAEGLLPSPDVTDEDEIVVALHRLLAAAPSRLVLASLYDILGEPRQPNLPGTLDEYPNWRIPLPVTLEEALADERVRRIAEVLDGR